MGDREREWEISHSVAAKINSLSLLSPQTNHHHCQNSFRRHPMTVPSACRGKYENQVVRTILIYHDEMHCKLLSKHMKGKELWRSNQSSVIFHRHNGCFQANCKLLDQDYCRSLSLSPHTTITHLSSSLPLEHGHKTLSLIPRPCIATCVCFY